MRALDRKLLRNLRTMKGQVIAIVLIVACGVASFVMVITAYRSLKASRETYYARYRMADLFASVKRAPRAALRDLERVPGVRRVEGRIVFDVTIDLPELAQPASGRTLSVPDHRRRILNDLHLTRGDWFTGDGTREVIVSDAFATTHGLAPGDTLRVLMNDKKEALRIVGTALSPEFVYLIRGGAEILPDPEHFTVLWLSQSFAEAVFAYEDAVNDVVASLERDAVVEDVILEFDRLLDRYGAFGSYARKDQASNRYLSDEIQGLEASATLMPMIFLGVAAFVLHVLMGRLVRTQRVQIAVFRAFGYGTYEIGRHYLQFALLVGALGGVLGIGFGLWAASGILVIYKEFFSFPVLRFGFDPVAIPVGLVISLVFSALGALSAVRAAARLEPAEGLHAEAPPVFQTTFLERMPFLWKRLGFVPRMVIRRLSRTKLRAAITVVGVMFAVALLFLTFFAYDANDVMMDVQFRLVDRQDAYVVFREERNRSALYEMEKLDGVRMAEPELIVPVKLVNGWRERSAAITGLETDHSLVALLDEDFATVPLPEEGLLLSRKLADLLGLRVGDDVEVRVLTGKKQRLRVPLASVVDEYMGLFAYARLETLARWTDRQGQLTAVRLVVDPNREAALGRELKTLPSVAGVTFKHQLVQVFRDTIAQSQTIMLGVVLLFAGIITFGVLYNTARISLAERHRELGSLRVLGYTHREVAALLVSENLVLAVVALAPGLAMGVFFCWSLTQAYQTDLYRFPFVITAANVLYTVVGTLAFAVLANLAVMPRLRRLDLVEVLKARE